MKKRYASYFALAAFLFVLLNLPLPFVQALRSKFLFAEGKGVLRREDELLALKVENKKLRDDLDEVRRWMVSQDRIESHIKQIEEITKTAGWGDLYKRQLVNLVTLLEKKVSATEATVIFRDPSFWGSGFWIDRGEKENRLLGRKIIAKHSPVLFEDALIGVVETVEENRSYVRLLTDPLLTPAVRALRGEEQQRVFLRHVELLEEELQALRDLVTPTFLQELSLLKQKLKEAKESIYLAKGELRGFSYPIWRGKSPLLKGVGFNYEFSDEEGASRTLHEKHKTPLLQVGDLLVTSGLDGLFPKGIPVATITKIFPLKEGDFAYELEALLVAGNLDTITHVTVLPSSELFNTISAH